MAIALLVALMLLAPGAQNIQIISDRDKIDTYTSEFDLPVYIISYSDRTIKVKIKFHLKYGFHAQLSFRGKREEFPDHVFKSNITPEEVELTLKPGEIKKVMLHITLVSKVNHWTLIASTESEDFVVCVIDYHMIPDEMPLYVKLIYVFTSLYYLLLEALYVLRWGRWGT